MSMRAEVGILGRSTWNWIKNFWTVNFRTLQLIINRSCSLEQRSVTIHQWPTVLAGQISRSDPHMGLRESRRAQEMIYGVVHPFNQTSLRSVLEFYFVTKNTPKIWDGFTRPRTFTHYHNPELASQMSKTRVGLPSQLFPMDLANWSQQLTASFELNTTLLIEPDSQRRMQSLQVRRWEGGESWVRVKSWLHWQLGEVGEDVSEEVGESEK